MHVFTFYSGGQTAAGSDTGGEQPSGTVQAGPDLHPVHGHQTSAGLTEPDAPSPARTDGVRLCQQDFQAYPTGHTGEIFYGYSFRMIFRGYEMHLEFLFF